MTGSLFEATDELETLFQLFHFVGESVKLSLIGFLDTLRHLVFIIRYTHLLVDFFQHSL